MKLNDNIRTFNTAHTAVAFPLGGIGTGNVSLGARGDLRDWEIFNRPAKGQNLPNTFFAIRLQAEGEAPLARVLEGPVQPPHLLSHGYHPSQNAGLPRFKDTTFHGEYPFARIDFHDDRLPVQVQLEAFTPLIPLNTEDSGIPCAVFTYIVTNTADYPVSLTLVGSMCNPVGGIQTDPYGNITGTNLVSDNRRIHDEVYNLHGLLMTTDEAPHHLDYGNISLVTDFPDVTIKPAWLRGAWWDFLQEFWDDLLDDGLLTDLEYESPPEDGKPDTGSLGIVDMLEPGESGTYRFMLTWYFPNRTNSWHVNNTEKVTRNHYATRFDDSWHVARYLIQEWERLYNGTTHFHDALFDSTLPPLVLDAISANIVPVRSTTCFWLEDGRFYGWEGCFDDAGCCAGSCTHVWSYAQTVAFLFPSLEREMRRIEFQIETQPDGYMYFRNFTSMDEQFVWAWGDQNPEAAVDGQMGSILRAYREWQLSGDKSWLGSIWPGIKNAIGYASSHWDTNGDNVLDGKQHNTYDIEFYGPNPLSSIYYLAALRAVEALARVMDEPHLADRCRNAFESGSAKLDDLLWNGEYFIQKIDNVDEHKYQHGEGCLSDQLLGQLHAHILNLGDLLPAEHVRKAIKSIFDYNFRPDFQDHTNCQRTYVLNDEAGLLLCTWPKGGRPRFPFVYSDEVWTGFEYQVAAHLIYEGWLDEGLTIVRAARDRHDGLRRNPWNEVECGHHYARTMSSWALLLALSGVHADAGQQTLDFSPVRQVNEVFKSFWSNGLAWGTFTQDADGRCTIDVLGGRLDGVQVTVKGKTI